MGNQIGEVDILGDKVIENMLGSNKMFLVKTNCKYFIGYLYDDYKIKLLNIILPKTTVYVKSYDSQTKSINFLIEDDDFLEKYNTIQDKVSADIKKELDRALVYSFLKTKIKSYGDEATDFHGKGSF